MSGQRSSVGPVLVDGTTRLSLWQLDYTNAPEGLCALIEAMDPTARGAVMQSGVIELDAAQVAVLRDALSEWLGAL